MPWRTTPEGVEAQPDFAPDARHVAFITVQDGMFGGFVAPFPERRPRWQIAPISMTLPRWSRDGQKVFFESSGDLYEVDIRTRPTFTAGIPRKLFALPGGSGFDVAADGERFLVVNPDPTVAQSSISIVINFTPE